MCYVQLTLNGIRWIINLITLNISNAIDFSFNKFELISYRWWSLSSWFRIGADLRLKLSQFLYLIPWAFGNGFLGYLQVSFEKNVLRWINRVTSDFRRSYFIFWESFFLFALPLVVFFTKYGSPLWRYIVTILGSQTLLECFRNS